MKNFLLVSLLAIILSGCTATAPTPQSNIAPTPTTPDVKPYSLTDVAKHNSSKDCWVAIGNKVYNLTDFIPQHPGGDQMLVGCGKDATALFNGTDPNGRAHSSRALAILPDFLIGNLQK